MSLKCWVKAALTINLLAVVYPAPALAAFSNYNSILIGDQAAGMGGAGTALASDVSSAAFYNPAGLAVLQGQSFSAAVGIYKKFDTTFGEEVDYTKAPLRVNQGFFRAIPSSTGNVFRRGDYTFGLSIVVPDFDNFKGDLRTTARNTTTLSYVDESLWAGGAIAKQISETESIGLTFYYTARSFNRSVSDRSFPNAGEAILFSSEKNIIDNSVVAVLGYQRKINDQWSFGSSLRPRNINVRGTGSYFETKVTTNPYSAPTKSLPDEKTRSQIPGKVTMGLAYKDSEDLLISADASFYEGISYHDFSDSSVGSHIVHREIWNLSLGAEKKFYPWLKARAGFFTNFSAHPDPTLEVAQHQPDKVDQLGFSANLAFVSNDHIEYTFGGYYNGGRGRSLQRIDQGSEVVVVTQHVFTMLVGTALSF